MDPHDAVALEPVASIHITSGRGLVFYLGETAASRWTTQSTGLNLALLGISAQRLQTLANTGDETAPRVLDLRRDSNFLLATILLDNTRHQRPADPAVRFGDGPRDGVRLLGVRHPQMAGGDARPGGFETGTPSAAREAVGRLWNPRAAG